MASTALPANYNVRLGKRARGAVRNTEGCENSAQGLQRIWEREHVRVCQTEVQLREWRIGNGGHGMGMRVSAREWRMRALEWKACNRMGFPHLEAIICI